MGLTQVFWNIQKEQVNLLEPYTLSETLFKLKEGDLYLEFLGKAKNRSLAKKDLRLYKSVLYHTSELERVFRLQKSYNSNWNLSARLRFLVEKKW